MRKENITPKQQEILVYIKETILKKGYPPAVREICKAVDLKSTSSVHSHLKVLERNGYIRRDPAKPRALEILDDAFDQTRRKMAQAPATGAVGAGQTILDKDDIHDYFPISNDISPSTQVFSLPD